MNGKKQARLEICIAKLAEAILVVVDHIIVCAESQARASTAAKGNRNTSASLQHKACSVIGTAKFAEILVEANDPHSGA